MRITSLEIMNYRSFSDTENKILFPKIAKPISIIGHNNSGKTNALQALLLGVGYSSDAQYKLRDYDFHDKKTDDGIDIKVMFDEAFPILSPYPGEKADKQCFGSRLESSYANGRPNTYIHCVDQNGTMLMKQEKMKARALPATFTSQKNDLKVIYINFHDIDKHLTFGSYGLLGELFRSIKQDFYDPANTITATSGDALVRKDIFETLTQKLKKVLQTDMLTDFVAQLGAEVTKSLDMPEDTVGFDFTLASARELYNKATLQVTDAAGKVSLPVTNLGAGLKAMIIVAMLKVLSEREDREKVFILEEPETFLHELYQDYLYNVLCKLAENNQVIYTTHSKKFIDAFDPASIVKINNPDFKGSSVVQVLEGLEVPAEVIKELSLSDPTDFGYFLRSLDPNLGLMLFARKVLLVEGPHDVLAYKLAFKDQGLSSKNIAIVSVWGKDTSVYICKLLKYFFVDSFVIHDWDLDEELVDVSLDPKDSASSYGTLAKVQKMHYTKNHKIHKAAAPNIHWNKKNLESVLDIQDKGATSIAAKLSGKSLADIETEFPRFMDEELKQFMEIMLTDKIK